MKIAIGGDICPIGRNEPVFCSGLDGLKEASKILSGFDLVMANLECPLIETPSPIRKIGPVLAASTETAAGLGLLGVNVVGIGNNHIMDHGEAGLSSTLQTLKRFGIKSVGANLDLESAGEPFFQDIDGTRLIVLAFAEREFSYATPTRPGACPLDVNLVVRKLLAIPKDCFTIVLLHGGNEQFPFPNPWLQDTCHLIAELGARLIVCQHNHCISAFESYGETLIVYGQGNLVFDGGTHPSSWWESVILSVSISGHSLKDFEFIPTVQDPGGQAFRLADEPERKSILDRMEGYAQVTSDKRQLEQEWLKFCEDKKRFYQSGLLGYGRLAAYANQVSGFADAIIPTSGKMRIGHVLQCASHLEVLRTIYSLDNPNQFI